MNPSQITIAMKQQLTSEYPEEPTCMTFYLVIPEEREKEMDTRQATPNDATKLHNEINLYISQRLIIVNTGITVFGVVTGWIIVGLSNSARFSNQISVSKSIQISSFTFLLSSILLILLFVLMLYGQQLLRQMHVLSTYLCVTKQSNWEDDYNIAFGEKPICFAQEDLVLIIFGCLGIFSFLIPIISYFLFRPAENTNTVIAITSWLFTSFLYLVGWIYLWIERYYAPFRKKITTKWEESLREYLKK